MIFLEKMWLESKEYLRGNYRSTNVPDFFKLYNKSSLMSPKKKEQCHHDAAKILRERQTTRPSMQLASVFHCARVKLLSTNDWVKLKHVIGCIWCTGQLILIIAIDDDGHIIIYIDEHHAMHACGKWNSGLFLMIGRGVVINESKKL